MKMIIIVIAGLIIAGAAYVLFIQKAPTTETPRDTTAQGKIDINAVCDAALSYMTFPDGASADTFLVECKAGNRPEVIEKYKADMGLGDGAQI